MSIRYFSVEEAREALPVVREHVHRMLEARRKILVLQPELWPELERASQNGGAKVGEEMIAVTGELRSHVQAILAMGVEIKDMNTGLVDFPHLREGREVCLCWKYDEDDIGWWHEADAGFAGRRPLDA